MGINTEEIIKINNKRYIETQTDFKNNDMATETSIFIDIKEINTEII